MDYFLEENIRELLREADDRGQIGEERDGRFVTITPSWARDCIDDRDLSGRFDLKFTDNILDLSRTIGQGEIAELKTRDAVRTIAVVMTGYCLEDTDDYFDQYINQADRECFVLESMVTPTRLRIVYDLPASGATTAWRHHVSFTTYRSHDEIERRTRHRPRRPDDHLQTTRYIARLY